MMKMRNEMNAEVLEKVTGGCGLPPRGKAYEDYLKRKEDKEKYGGAAEKF